MDGTIGPSIAETSWATIEARLDHDIYAAMSVLVLFCFRYIFLEILLYGSRLILQAEPPNHQSSYQLPFTSNWTHVDGQDYSCCHFLAGKHCWSFRIQRLFPRQLWYMLDSVCCTVRDESHSTLTLDTLLVLSHTRIERQEAELPPYSNGLHYKPPPALYTISPSTTWEDEGCIGTIVQGIGFVALSVSGVRLPRVV